MYRIKSWKLALLGLFFVCVFFALGCWQVQRANEKKLLLKHFQERTQQNPLNQNNLSSNQDLRFYRVELLGEFDNSKNFLLDNKIYQQQIGYEIYTVFNTSQQSYLIDRGFLPIKNRRDEAPSIQPILGKVTIVAILNEPPRYFSLGGIKASNNESWPLKIEYVDIKELSQIAHQHLFPYVLMLSEKNALNYYPTEPQIISMTPEKHMGYAVPWFALSLSLLIISLVLNRQR